jgi:hypothetical protein
MFVGVSTQVSAQTVDKDWLGKYEFFDSESKFRGRPSNFVTYSLTISQKKDNLVGRFLVDATQLSQEFDCTVKIVGDSIKVYFLKVIMGNNDGMAKPFRTGQLLFTLTKTKVKNKTKYLFTKSNYEIYLLSEKQSSKIYFSKK